jgi:hypothetical protein
MANKHIKKMLHTTSDYRNAQLKTVNTISNQQDYHKQEERQVGARGYTSILPIWVAEICRT